jgi:RNA polymerase sigma-70 factor (ECF subfamily)
MGHVGPIDPRHFRNPVVMAAPSNSSTSVTLLGRLASSPSDQAAWGEFVDRYGKRVLQWARAWGLQDADVQEVSQQVLTRVFLQLPKFRYDPSGSFRGWLRTIVHHAAHDALAAAPRDAGAGGTESLRLLDNLEARSDLVRRIEREFDLELLEQATRDVRQRVEPATWRAYELTACEQRPPAEVAATLGMKVGAVYQAKSSVLRQLRDEIARFEARGSEPPGSNPDPPGEAWS